MKTKQLLEIALKITGIVIIVPTIISLPTTLYISLGMFLDQREETPWMLIFSLAIYVAVIYYLVFNTTKVVDYIYKEKEEEKEINFNFNRTNTIFLAVVLSTLFGLATTLPSFLIELIRGMKESMYGGAGLDGLINIFDNRQNSNYFITSGLQIIVLILILLNARRITAWIELYRKKQMKKSTISE